MQMELVLWPPPTLSYLQYHNHTMVSILPLSLPPSLTKGVDISSCSELISLHSLRGHVHLRISRQSSQLGVKLTLCLQLKKSLKLKLKMNDEEHILLWTVILTKSEILALKCSPTFVNDSENIKVVC